MTTLHLMVGLPGVGKTTLALTLARDLPALRLSADDLQLALFGDDMAHPDHNARHDAIEAALWPLALGALRAGADVILDFGFWSRAERQHLRALAADAGFGSALHVPPDPGPNQRLQRIAGRKSGFTVTAADMAAYDALYEPPDADELAARPTPVP
jgi:predicted kinase